MTNTETDQLDAVARLRAEDANRVAAEAQVQAWADRHEQEIFAGPVPAHLTNRNMIQRDEIDAYAEPVPALPVREPGRAAGIAGIRALATWLEDNPMVPMPSDVKGYAHVSTGANRAHEVRGFAMFHRGTYYEIGQHRYAKIVMSDGVDYVYSATEAGPPLSASPENLESE